LTAKAFVSAAALALLVFGSGRPPGFASTSASSFGVTATVVSGCDVSAVTAYSSYAEAIDRAAASASVACSLSVPYLVSLQARRAESESARTKRFVEQGMSVSNSGSEHGRMLSEPVDPQPQIHVATPNDNFDVIKESFILTITY
jgi:spore coat protein U-like protein